MQEKCHVHVFHFHPCISIQVWVLRLPVWHCSPDEAVWPWPRPATLLRPITARWKLSYMYNNVVIINYYRVQSTCLSVNVIITIAILCDSFSFIWDNTKYWLLSKLHSVCYSKYKIEQANSIMTPFKKLLIGRYCFNNRVSVLAYNRAKGIDRVWSKTDQLLPKIRW